LIAYRHRDTPKHNCKTKPEIKWDLPGVLDDVQVPEAASRPAAFVECGLGWYFSGIWDEKPDAQYIL